MQMGNDCWNCAIKTNCTLQTPVLPRTSCAKSADITQDQNPSWHQLSVVNRRHAQKTKRTKSQI